MGKKDKDGRNEKTNKKKKDNGTDEEEKKDKRANLKYLKNN